MSKTNIDVSFIIPVFNGESTLSACLRSIYHQTCSKLEIIVVDNCSTDLTRDIVLTFPEVHYRFTSVRNRSHARNLGAQLAHGKYLCFVDCDVILDKTWLETGLKYLENRPVDFLATQVVPYCSESVVDQYRYFFAEWKSHSSFLSIQKRTCLFPVINTAASIVSKLSFYNVGQFNEKLHRNEDLELSLRFYTQGYLLGGTSAAKSKVQFGTKSNVCRNAINYIIRSFYVQFYSLFRSDRRYKMNFKQLWMIFLKTMSLKLLVFSFFVEVSAFIGSLLSSLSRQPKTDLDHYILKGGKKNFVFTFFFDGRHYFLKNGLSFLFKDNEIYSSENFSVDKFERLPQKYETLFVKLLHNEVLTENEKRMLILSNFYQ